jgi:hypothetical protein
MSLVALQSVTLSRRERPILSARRLSKVLRTNMAETIVDRRIAARNAASAAGVGLLHGVEL